MSETNHLKDLEAKHAETIQNIEKLQELEKYMFQNLQKMSPGGGQSAMEQEAIVNKISELKTIRTDLLGQLSSMYRNKQTELNSERVDLSDKIAQVGIVESELARARKNIGMMEDDRNNKLRMAQLYEYERKRYGAYTDVMKIIVYVCLVVLALTLLIKYNPIPFIPTHVYSLLLSLSIVVGVVLVIRKVLDINSRNNLNFDQYDFYFDPSTVQPGYETVYQHDVGFFKKLENEVESSKYFNEAENEYNKVKSEASKYANKAKNEMNKAGNKISNMAHNLGNGTAAGAGSSNGVSNDPTAVAKVPGGSSVVMPSESSKENFAPIF